MSNHIAVTEETFNNVAKYLQKRPYEEVAVLLGELAKSKRVELNQPEDSDEDVEGGE